MENRKRINFMMPLDLADFAENEAKSLGLSLTGYINILVSHARKEKAVVNMAYQLQEEGRKEK